MPEPTSGGETATSTGSVQAVKEPRPTLTTGMMMGAGTAVLPETVTGSQKPELDEPQPIPVKGITKLTWNGEIAAQKWVNFYMKVLTKFASNHDLTLLLRVEITGADTISPQKLEEMKAALRELGLDDAVTIA